MKKASESIVIKLFLSANNIARAKIFLESFNAKKEFEETYNENYNQLKDDHKNTETSNSLIAEYLKASEESTEAAVDGIPDIMDDSTMNQNFNHINSLLEDVEVSFQ